MRAFRSISPAILTSVIVIAGLAGCASPRAEPLRNSFLPRAPKVAPAQVFADPPEVPVMHSLDRDTPSILNPQLEPPSPPSRFDARLRRAEERLQEGKRLYLAGDKQGARREFDAAVDLLLSGPDSLTSQLRLDKRFEDLVDQIYRYDVEGLGAGNDKQEIGYDKAPMDEIMEMTFPIDPKLKNKLQEEVAATTSQLPLTVNDEVLRYVNYFSSERGKRIVTYGLRRAGRYKPMIQRILEQEGVPQELIYLAQAESAFMPRAISRRRASGMWQFVLFRGREYGLRQTVYTDERLDPEKATRAAARHLHDLYNKMGDWYLALAAYNCGPLCVDRAVQRTGYADFWSLRARGVLPIETTNYVPIILAMTIMSKNAKDYGLDEIDADPPLEYETVTFPTGTNLDLVAAAAERSLAEIRELNPSLLKNLAPAGYEIHLPKRSSASVMTAVEAVPPNKRDWWRLHRVQEGDTMAQIAKRYGCTVSALTAANAGNLDTDLQAGDILAVPMAPPRAKAPVRSAARKAPAGAASSASKTAVAQRSGGSKPSSSAAKKPAAKPAAYQTASVTRKPSSR